jgi:hypothetical protein
MRYSVYGTFYTKALQYAAHDTMHRPVNDVTEDTKNDFVINWHTKHPIRPIRPKVMGIWKLICCISSSSRHTSASSTSRHGKCPQSASLLRLHNRSPSDGILGRDDRWRLRDVLAEDLGPEEPREPDEEFVADELLCRDLEDLCDVCVSR